MRMSISNVHFALSPLPLPPVPCRKKDDRLSYRKHYKLIVGYATYKKQRLLYGNEGDLLRADDPGEKVTL
jgi:hypothetical protein